MRSETCRDIEVHFLNFFRIIWSDIITNRILSNVNIFVSDLYKVTFDKY